MGFHIEFKTVSFGVPGRADILSNINGHVEAGQFVVLLGENGAGKTTLLDLVMGFKKPAVGEVHIEGQLVTSDVWQLRQRIVYLSEKVDIPADWSVSEFLHFNRFFYECYSSDIEKKLSAEFRINLSSRLGSMSAGEIRRVQIVAALATRPELIIVDEITAVLDIVGRRRFLKILCDLNRENGCTVLLSTNIIEGLENFATHVLILRNGQERVFVSVKEFLSSPNKSDFSEAVVKILEET